MRRWVLFILAAMGVAGVVPVLQAADGGKFAAELESFAKDDKRQRPPYRPVLFVGSSSIRLWTNLAATFPEWPVINRGFGGSTMADLLQCQDRLVTPYDPRLIVVYEGDNDLSNGTAVDAVVGHFRQFLERLEWDLPGTPVILLAVKPSPSRKALLPQQRELNARIAGLAGDYRGVTFVDTFTPMLDAQGEPDARWFQSDGLHLNLEGYARWIPAVRAAMESGLARSRSKSGPP